MSINETCCICVGQGGSSCFEKCSRIIEKLSSVIVNTLFRYIPRSTRYLIHSLNGTAVSTGKLLSRTLVTVPTLVHGRRCYEIPWCYRYSIIVGIGSSNRCSTPTWLKGTSPKFTVKNPNCRLQCRSAATYFSLSVWKVFVVDHLQFVSALLVTTSSVIVGSNWWRSVGSSVIVGIISSMKYTWWKQALCIWRYSYLDCASS